MNEGGMRGDQFTQTDNYVSAFSGPGRILWVCATAPLAKDKWIEMGRPEGIRMCYPGAALMGSKFDEIILDDICSTIDLLPRSRSRAMRAHTKAWSEHLRCRLSPGGKMRRLVKVKS